MNTRKDNNGKAMKRWLATPPGHIAKPLRYIVTRNSAFEADGKVVLGAKAITAFRAAKRGDGLTLQQMARAI
jgi:hypothetical protein